MLAENQKHQKIENDAWEDDACPDVGEEGTVQRQDLLYREKKTGGWKVTSVYYLSSLTMYTQFNAAPKRIEPQ